MTGSQDQQDLPLEDSAAETPAEPETAEEAQRRMFREALAAKSGRTASGKGARTSGANSAGGTNNGPSQRMFRRKSGG
jgi:hypothetical protein